MPTAGTDAFRAARDFLLAHREDYDTAYEKFRWPRPGDVQLGAGLVRRASPRATTPAGAVIVEAGRRRGGAGPTRSCPAAPTRWPNWLRGQRGARAATGSC